MPSCLNCNTILNQGRNCTGKYCNNQCQADYKRNQIYRLVEIGEAKNSRQVREYLLSKNGHVCMGKSCAWDFTKVQINVELEHIDGNSENNTLENCTLLCPNCHSLTPTYKNRNRGNGRHTRRQRYDEGKSY